MDRLIGADRLKPGMRSQLLFEQVQAISQMTPVTSAGALAISLLLMAMSRDAAVLAVDRRLERRALCRPVRRHARLAARQAQASRTRKPSPNAVRAAFLNSAFMGMVWGVLPILLLPSGDPVLP